MVIKFGQGHNITTHKVVKVLRTLPPGPNDEIGECVVQIDPPHNGVRTVTVPQDCLEEDANVE